MKVADPSFAANAYRMNQNMVQKAVSNGDEDTTTGGTGDSGGVSFADFLKDKASDAVETIRDSEAISAKAVTGEANLTEVVQAVTDAELTLQTVVAVRDRMISAYQDIMSMPI
ncbi:MAG: flagellar hook-basal body complex protein FliE [Alphaproteobacteria bacterium]